MDSHKQETKKQQLDQLERYRYGSDKVIDILIVIVDIVTDRVIIGR